VFVCVCVLCLCVVSVCTRDSYTVETAKELSLMFDMEILSKISYTNPQHSHRNKND